MFEVYDRPLEELNVAGYVKDTKSGGIVTFEGRVRDHNRGQQVCALEYEVYEALARREAENILQEAANRFGVRRSACLQRVGILEVGELSTWIGVAAVHRDAAFKACRYVIDAYKARVPVWKKEHYGDGSSRWINTPRTSTRTSDTSD